MKNITVKGLTIGEGIPKICVPIVGRTLSELVEEASLLSEMDIDLVEWRVDFFEQVEEIEKVKEALGRIRTVLPHQPLLFTFRSKQEGGEQEVSTEYYLTLNREISQTGLVELIDVELFNEENDVKELITIAHENDVLVIVSNHDFEKTPSKEEIVLRLETALHLGADLPKIAVMPQTSRDVLTLLEASNTMSEKYPDTLIITMSMGGIGAISRLTGEIFGSCVTFGAVKKASAPGQINAQELRNWLGFLHNNINK